MKNCKQCGKNITHLKANAIFCTANCRVKFSNAQRKISIVPGQGVEEYLILLTKIEDIEAILGINKKINTLDKNQYLISSDTINEIFVALGTNNVCEIERERFDFEE